MRSHQLGRNSEDVACAYLAARGWTILARNYRAGHKEIDIIAGRGQTVAFIEVKARSGTDRGHPLEAITWAKRREVVRAARAWVRQNGAGPCEYRFDAIAIVWNGASHVLEHLENAWWVR